MEPIQVTSNTTFDPKSGHFILARKSVTQSNTIAMPENPKSYIFVTENFNIATTKSYNWFQKLMYKLIFKWEIKEAK
jgi:hypothetical protein